MPSLQDRMSRPLPLVSSYASPHLLHASQALLYARLCLIAAGLLRIILLTEMEYLPAVEVLSKRESLCNPLNEFGIQCEAEMAARKSDVHM